MQTRSLLALAAAAVLAAAGALWLSSERSAETARSVDEPLFPGLMAGINDVQALEIFDAGGPASVRLERVEGVWRVQDRAGFPAQVPELRRALIALAESRVIEPKTSNPDFYARIGVEDPATEGAESRRVQVTLADGSGYELIAGDTGFRGQTTTFVRRGGEAASWIATGNLALDADPNRWLAKEVIDLPTPAVRRVVIEHPDGNRVEIAKAERALPNFTLVNLPEGRELLAPSTPNSIAGALGGLRLDDVVGADAFDPGDQQPIVATYEAFDGRRVTVRAWRIDDIRYLALEPGYDPAIVVPEPAASAEDAATEAETGTAAAVPDVAARADADRERTNGWVFAVPSYKYSNLTKRLDDLLKPLEDAASVPPE